MRKVFNNKVLLFIVGVLLLANIAWLMYFSGIRDRGRRYNDHQKSPITVFLKDSIGLNAQQMAAFEALRQHHRQKMRLLSEDVRLTKVRFYNLLSDTTTTDSVLNRAARSIAEKQQAMEMQTFHNFREIRGLTTATQKPRYDSLIPGLISKMWFLPRNENYHGNKDSVKGR